MCLKNDAALTFYNFSVHQPILFIFGSNTDKEKVKWYFIFSPHITSASALPHKTWKHENCIFSLSNVVLLLFRVQPVAALFFKFVDLPLIFLLL